MENQLRTGCRLRTLSPMHRRTRPRPVIRTQIQLHRLWERLRSVDSAPCTKVLFIAPDGRTTRKVVTLTDLDGPLEPEQQAEFAVWLDDILDGDAGWWRVGLLICRPGQPHVEHRDLIWAATLRRATRRSGAGCDVMHLQVGQQILPVPLDDLPANAIGEAFP